MAATSSDNQLKRTLVVLQKVRERLETYERAAHEPLALLGIGGRLPGAKAAEDLWQVLVEGRDAVVPVPDARREIWASCHHGEVALKEPSMLWGGMVEDIELFDAPFFRIGRPEAEALDPQQRMLLEATWEALEDAGIAPSSLVGSKTGVYVGISHMDYADLEYRASQKERIDVYSYTGGALSVAAGRISFVFGLEGPALALDTACSSSLVALHLAAESLRRGEVDLAIVGGVNLLLAPAPGVAMVSVGAISPDGRCHTFDASANGYVRAEGCGVVVLKRLSDAQAAGDSIRSLVRGSAINHDGRSSGLTAPNGLSQEAVIRQALKSAEVAPEAVSYLEAHGTGTPLGDPIEVGAIAAVYGENRPRDRQLAIGTVKSNIGHLESAAGIAGVIKVTLALQHREIPGNLHFHTLNPAISLDSIPAYVPVARRRWDPVDGARIAAVSAFGISGTNAHAILSEAPADAPDKWTEADRLASEAKLLPLFLSAKTAEALRAYATRYAEHFDTPLASPTTWRDVAYTSSVRRDHLEHRLVVVGDSVSTWRDKLRAFASGELPPGLLTGEVTRPLERVVFVFSGQGTQWWGMGRELLEREAVFREALEECAQYISKDASWSLLEELRRDEASSQLHRTDIAQPAIVSLQLALVRLLASWGIVPSAVVGHSVGEISAACAAGVLTLEEACYAATVRGRVMHKASGTGKMAAVRLSAEGAEEAVRPFRGKLVVGAYNGPESSVLSGDADAVTKALAALAGEGVETKELRVDYAFHSHQMEPFGRELATELASLDPKPARIPIVSTLTGTVEGAKFDSAYWVRQMCEPVRFVEATETLLQRDHELFVEVGPHPVLLASIDETAALRSKKPTLVPTLKRNEEQVRCAIEALGALHCAGCQVDWPKAFGGVPGRVASLPRYPWQHQRYWVADGDARSASQKKSKRRESDSPWALLGTRFENSDEAGKLVFETELDIAEGSAHSYLADHKVQGSVWFPGAGFLEMALEGARWGFEGRSASIESVTLSQALVLMEGDPTLVQLVVQPERDGVSAFSVSSRSAKDSGGGWTQHVSGQIRFHAEGAAASASKAVELAELQRRCTLDVPVVSLYERFVASGLSYGKAFQGIESVGGGDREALAKLVPVAKLTARSSGYLVHPSLLDAAFQTAVVASRAVITSDRTYVPSTIESLRTVRDGEAAWAHVKMRSASDEAAVSDIRLFDDKGTLLAEVVGLRTVPLGRAMDKLDERLFEIAWRSAPSSASESTDGRWLLIADEQGVANGLRTWLEGRGADVVTVTRGNGFRKVDAKRYELDLLEPEPIRRLMNEAFGTGNIAPKRVVYLASLDTRASSDGPLNARRAEELTCTSILHLVQAVSQVGWNEAPRLFVVTRGCQPAQGSRDVTFPEQALAWGFCGTVVHEMPELQTTLIDLDASVTADALGRELASADDENRVALRGQDRLVARLLRSPRPKPSAGASRALTVNAEEGYVLDPLEVGKLESLTLQPAKVPTPGPGQVVIRTRASGVNFRDVLIALGLYPGLGDGRPSMGTECAGVVHSVGAGTTLRPGDEVVATTFLGFDAYAVVDARLVAKKPAALSFAQAASMPTVATTVLYALGRVGRLRKGERILIHAAAGGVGLTAVQYAKHVGAEIFATAGSEDKRNYLRSLGVTHVYDSRTLAWADQIRADTGGRGVDVVLNSLAGQAIAKGLSVLAPFGRFLEIGKRDIYENTALGMYAMRNNISVSAVALDQLNVERPDESRELLEDALRLVAQGALSALPIECYPVSRASDAFEHLARARHIGKVVLTAEDQVTVRDPSRSELVPSDKTLLVTGGLGGLGLVVAKRLAKLGAKHLALMGRSAPSESAKLAIQELEGAGTKVYVVGADVARASSLRDAFAELARTAPPIGGVIHAAGIVDDAALSNLTAARIGPVLAPKLLGALALDETLPDLSLRVYFASVAGLLGSPGQAHYAAGNAFLDAYAHHLTARARHALSLDWGAWAEVGIAARMDATLSLEGEGLSILTPTEGGDLFERVLPSRTPQLAPFPLDVNKRRAKASTTDVPLYRELVGASPKAQQKDARRATATASSTPEWVAILEGLSTEDRKSKMEELVSGAITQILKMPPGTVSVVRPLREMGIDSLSGIQLARALSHGLGITLRGTVTLRYPNVRELSAHVLDTVFGEQKDKQETKRDAAPSEQRAAASPVESAAARDDDDASGVTARRLEDAIVAVQRRRRQ